jgi:hypothetical protein
MFGLSLIFFQLFVEKCAVPAERATYPYCTSHFGLQAFTFHCRMPSFHFSRGMLTQLINLLVFNLIYSDDLTLNQVTPL